MPSIPWSSPDPDLELMHIYPTNESLLITLKSNRSSSTCPSCSKKSSRIHSHYTRKVQDLPIGEKSVELLILSRRWFCDNPDCNVKIFTERFEWLSSNGRRTKRTEDVLRKMAFSTSCLSAEKLAKSANIPVSHDTLLALIHQTVIESEVSPFRGY
jgi:transposase